MGNFAAFAIRVKRDHEAKDVAEALRGAGGRDVVVHENTGLVTGLHKASYPGGHMQDMLHLNGIDNIAIIGAHGDESVDFMFKQDDEH